MAVFMGRKRCAADLFFNNVAKYFKQENTVQHFSADQALALKIIYTESMTAILDL